MGLVRSIADSAAQYKVVVTSFASNATVQQALGANPNRVALHISDNAGSVFVGTDSGKLGTAKGEIQIVLNSPNWYGTFDWFGPWIQSAWFTCRVSGASTTTFTEIIATPTGS